MRIDPHSADCAVEVANRQFEKFNAHCSFSLFDSEDLPYCIEHVDLHCDLNHRLEASNDWVMAAIALRPATSTTSSSGGTATTTRYFLPDQLNSTNVITDASGTVGDVLDYYLYGAIRIDTETNYGGVRNKYAESRFRLSEQ
jgi:hypothetical protein